jgi:2-polyprenyl-3-methyl-5-hydroxy-6-metoxy-1,4-benzoquinol methylase
MILFCPRCRQGQISLENTRCAYCHFEARVEGKILDLRSPVQHEDYSECGAAALAEVECEHFWFAERRRMILDVLRRAPWPSTARRLLDLGCGSGYMLEQLERAGFKMIGADMHIGGLRLAAERSTAPLICGRVEDLSLADPVDAVALLDVIEHAADDGALLRQAATLVRRGGLLLVTVPALRQLWSEFDVKGGHKRRYHARELRQLFRDAGLESLSVHYFFSFAVLPIWLQRRRIAKRAPESNPRYLRPPPPMVNRILAAAAGAERLAIRAGMKMPVGSSLIGLGRVR